MSMDPLKLDLASRFLHCFLGWAVLFGSGCAAFHGEWVASVVLFGLAYGTYVIDRALENNNA